MTKKVKVIVSDFHLGKGKKNSDGSDNLLEDFEHDREFIEFMEYFRSGEYTKKNVELILNGDFFNLLQIDYRDRFPDYITESASLHKIMKIIHGHEELFSKMAEFSQTKNHKVVFVLGNHDPGLLWAGVQEALRFRLQGMVEFYMEEYLDDGVFIEHGNQYYADNRYDRSCYFIEENLPEPIINLPFGSFFIIHYMNEIKKQRHYFDKVYPMRNYYKWAFIHDTFFAIKAIAKLIFFFIYFHIKPNPARKLNFWQSFQIIREAPIHPSLDREAKRLLLSNSKVNVVVFGHTHQAVFKQFAQDKYYINTGTWNERVNLDIGNLGKQTKHTFAYIEQDDYEIKRAALYEWKGKREIISEFSR